MRKQRYSTALRKRFGNRLYMNTYLSLTDNTELEIDNCKRIIEYNDIFIKVKTNTLILQIWGENLKISDYNTGGIVVSGKLSSIEFERGGK